jgi:hypothetical protein
MDWLMPAREPGVTKFTKFTKFTRLAISYLKISQAKLGDKIG